MNYRTIQRLFQRAGLQIGFDHPVRNAPKLFAFKAAELGVKTVLDIGANIGQFARELRRAGYRGDMLSFEPLSAVYASLLKVAEGDASWHIAPRMALGDVPGTAEINVAQNLASSSFLQVRQRSVQAAAESGYVAKEMISIYRLEDVLDLHWSTPFAMKLDTQGFELRILSGAPNILAQTSLLMVEMSLVDLYDGGPGFAEMYRFLEAKGFRCVSLVQGFADNKRHELLQVDGVFVRR